MQDNTKTLKNSKTPNMLTSFQEVSPVKTLVLRTKKIQMELQGNGVDYGKNTLELYGTLDLNTYSLRIAQCSLFEDLNTSYA